MYSPHSAVYYALRYTRKTRPGASWYEKLDFMAYSLIAVGITSIAFHGTLRHTNQYLDEISMFLLAGALLYPIWSANQSRAVSALVASILIAGIGGASVVYVRSGDILIHTWTFIILLTFVWPRALYLIQGMGRPEEEVRIHMQKFWRGAGGMILGYALWNVDLELCWQLRDAREKIGLPLGFLLELHGWWHFLTALGASYYIRLVRDLTDDEHVSNEKVSSSSSYTNGKAVNGKAKKP